MQTTNTPKLELHIIQNFPPHNMNRDDSGSPKDTEFGGYRRARVSSQCLKRSIRWSEVFRAEVGGRIAARTKRSAGEIARILHEQYGHDKADALAVACMTIGQLVSAPDDKGETSVLFYVGPDELEELASRLHGAWDTIEPAIAAAASETAAGTAKASDGEVTGADKAKKVQPKGGKKAAKEAGDVLTKAVQPVVDAYKRDYDGSVGTVDVALFGRMLAENPTLNMDAACHVAHAIGTNRVSMEYDYFTAVDDLNRDPADTGAAMIGTTMYNSSCFYRYAVVDVGQLHRNLGGDRTDGARALALAGLRAFIKGSIAAIPSGKQSSTAAYTQPSLVMAVVRPRGELPVSLANAFESPVSPRGGDGLVSGSIKALDRHWSDLTGMYGDGGARPFIAVVPSEREALANLTAHVCIGVPAMIEAAMQAIEEAWANGGAA